MSDKIYYVNYSPSFSLSAAPRPFFPLSQKIPRDRFLWSPVTECASTTSSTQSICWTKSTPSSTARGNEKERAPCARRISQDCQVLCPVSVHSLNGLFCALPFS